MRIRIKHFRQSDDNQQFTGNASFLGGSPWGPRLSVTCLKLIFRWSSRETSVPDQVRGQLVTAYTATGKKRHVQAKENAAADLAKGLLQAV